MTDAAGSRRHDGPSGVDGFDVEAFEATVAALDAQVERSSASDGLDQSTTLVEELQVATEELRAASAELRSQRDQLAALRVGGRAAAQVEMLLSAIPLPTLVVDGAGLIAAANPAAGILLETRAASLVGKPVQTLVELDHRREVRDRLAEQGGDGRPFRHGCVLVTKSGAPVQVEVNAAVVPGRLTDAFWMLLPDPEPDPRHPVGSTREVARQVLPEVLVRLAALGVQHDGVDELLAPAAALCKLALGADVELSVQVGPPTHPDATVSTATLAQRLDGLQLSHSEGPCVEAFQRSATVVTDDLRSEDRWPAVAAQTPHDVGAVVAVTIASGEGRLGALNVYRRVPGTDLALVATAELLAATLAAVLQQLAVRAELRTTVVGVQQALESRAVIDQAKGVIMGDRGLNADDAFAHLVELASRQEVKVRDLAREIVERRGG